MVLDERGERAVGTELRCMGSGGSTMTKLRWGGWIGSENHPCRVVRK